MELFCGRLALFVQNVTVSYVDDAVLDFPENGRIFSVECLQMKLLIVILFYVLRMNQYHSIMYVYYDVHFCEYMNRNKLNVFYHNKKLQKSTYLMV